MSEEKQKYDFLPQLENRSNVHRIEMDMVAHGSLVLDVGCHTGIMGEALKERKEAKVIGLDTDVNALHIARGRLDAALMLDVEGDTWAEHLIAEGYSRFDAIIFGDVLEHTRRPERILSQAKKLLSEGGIAIVSVPNVAHWRVRLGLFFGKFEYTDHGILDRTHLRFFTQRTSRRLIEESGFRVMKQDVAGYALPHWLIRLLPGLFAVQIVMSATPME